VRGEKHGPGALTALIVIAAVSFLAASPRFSPARESGAGDIRVTIEKIQYAGGDRYTLVVSLENVSSRDVLVRPLEEGFFIQLEHDWAPVNITDVGKTRDSPDILLPSGVNKERPASIVISLALPDLFRTYEGDLSLMYKYAYSVREADGAGAAFRKADEVYCWVKPGTSQWILREGM
jgi:hypothetical protein